MKTLLFVFLFSAAALHCQTDFFTGAARPQPAAPPLQGEAKDPPLDTPLEPAPPLPSSFVLILGEDALPPLANGQGLRGYEGAILWDEIPDLGFDKTQIKEIRILKREIVGGEGGSLEFRPSLWHFRADTWQTVYGGEIPYLEGLMFLGDRERIRLSTRVSLPYRMAESGFTQNHGLYGAVNSPQPGAVSRIILVPGSDNSEMRRMAEALEKASTDVPVKAKAPPAEFPQGAQNIWSAEGGISIFEKILEER